MNEYLQQMLTRNAIIVKQETEMSNVALQIDAANRYGLFDPSGEALGMANEISGGVGGWFMRQFLEKNRPCTIVIYDKQGQEIASGKKPFRFIFSEISAKIGEQTLGRARRRFSALKRKYTIDVEGAPGFEIKSSIFQFGNYTFDVTKNGQVVATIAKKFEGVLKRAFTQADTFSIEFKDESLTLEERCTLLFTLFLIDFDVFEQN